MNTKKHKSIWQRALRERNVTSFPSLITKPWRISEESCCLRNWPLWQYAATPFCHRQIMTMRASKTSYSLKDAQWNKVLWFYSLLVRDASSLLTFIRIILKLGRLTVFLGAFITLKTPTRLLRQPEIWEQLKQCTCTLIMDTFSIICWHTKISVKIWRNWRPLLVRTYKFSACISSISHLIFIKRKALQIHVEKPGA
jgi:hypothetical protein